MLASAKNPAWKCRTKSRRDIKTRSVSLFPDVTVLRNLSGRRYRDYIALHASINLMALPRVFPSPFGEAPSHAKRAAIAAMGAHYA
jgi:hypothetical protein